MNSIRPAALYDKNDRYILIRVNSETGHYCWCHPADGDVHGSTTSDYVQFDTYRTAFDVAQKHGFTIVSE